MARQADRGAIRRRGAEGYSLTCAMFLESCNRSDFHLSADTDAGLNRANAGDEPHSPTLTGWLERRSSRICRIPLQEQNSLSYELKLLTYQLILLN